MENDNSQDTEDGLAIVGLQGEFSVAVYTSE